jgi:hypothetical protein
MRIAFSVTIDDLLSFNRFHFGRSPKVRSALLRTRLSVVLAIVAVSCVLSIKSENGGVYIVGALLATITYLLLSRRLMLKRMQQATLRMFSKGANPGNLLGNHSLDVQHDGLFVKSKTAKGLLPWSSIHLVEETNSHVFIYIGANLAHIIRKASIRSGRLDSFIAAVRDHIREGESSSAEHC